MTDITTDRDTHIGFVPADYDKIPHDDFDDIERIICCRIATDADDFIHLMVDCDLEVMWLRLLDGSWQRQISGARIVTNEAIARLELIRHAFIVGYSAAREQARGPAATDE